MKKSKKRAKRRQKATRQKQSPLKNKRIAILLGLVILPALLIGGYITAQSGGDGKGNSPSETNRVQGSPQSVPKEAAPAIYAATFSLREVYEQLYCLCGNCNKVLANCVCGFGKAMKDQVRQAKGERKTQNEILNLMVKRYGTKVLASKAELAKRQPPPGTPRPAIYVEPPFHDFGTIPQEIVTHSFSVRNKGDKDLVISNITTSCGCTTAEIDKNSIPPGEEGTLTVTFDPIVHDTKGKTTRTVSLETNDPSYPIKKIKIKAFVKKEGKAAEKLPSFAYNSAQTLEGYRIATQIPHVLEVIPCYCGCGNQSGHRHLKDCFIKADGSYDDHGAGCNLCDREAIDVKKWLDQNVPIKTIRARIDKKYKKFGPPTPTPPV